MSAVRVNDRSGPERPATKLLGRPRDPAKVDAIVAAGWRLFLSHGLAPVTMDRIAAEAGVAKATVYANFPDKRTLFAEGVRREMAAIEAAQGLTAPLSEAATLRDVLVAFGIGIMSFLTSAGAVDFYASLAGDLRKDPELARMFFDAGPGRTQANLTDILAGPMAVNLDIPDARDAAELLIGMWQGVTNYRAMLGVDHQAVIDAIPEKVAAAVDRFLKAFTR